MLSIPPSPNFDSIARPYRWLEYLSFGPFLHRTRIHYLSQLANCRSALVLGDGDGRFTAALLAHNQQIRIHAIDLSPAMLAALGDRCRQYSARLTTQLADLRHWTPAVDAGAASELQPSPELQYDLVITHFFLDCLTTQEIAALAARLTPAATPEALWLVSDFAIPPTIFGRLIAAPLIAMLYLAFRLLTGLRVDHLPDHSTTLTTAGWTLRAATTPLKGLLISQLWRRSAPDH